MGLAPFGRVRLGPVVSPEPTQAGIFLLRPAVPSDVGWLANCDLAADREDARGEPLYFDGWGEPDRQAHRAHIARFVSEPNHWAWVCERGGLVGMILGRMGTVGDGDIPVLTPLLPPGERYVEVFQLWVEPHARRQGIGVALKRQLEILARAEGAALLYTHTRARNAHVLALNHKLQYQEIHRGPLWDEIVRVCLVKWL